jgi:hypothetical protein
MHFRDLHMVERLIQSRIPESGSLEYKSELSLAVTEARRELLKDLTGMGNGGGGTVIFGMQEETGTSIAKEIKPIVRVAVGQIEHIVRAAVHPPLVWSCSSFEVDGGSVLLVDVEPSMLGPYMVDAYKERRYYKRAGDRVHPMSKQEVRDVYAIALRATERRSELWKEHFLPVLVPPNEPWVIISALPQEPLREIFDPRQIDLGRFRVPTLLENYTSHTGLTFATAQIRHWRDGLACDDGANGVDPNTILRLHRDGAAGIAVRWRTDLNVDWVARVINALVLYLARFWDEFSLSRPVELKLSFVGLSEAPMPAEVLTPARRTLVEPSGVHVSDVAVTDELLPWELLRASVRHQLLRRFCDRLEQAFGQPSHPELFEWGRLFDQSRSTTGLALNGGLVWDERQGQGVAVGSVDSAGRVVSGTDSGKVFVLDGVLLDHHGDALAVLEMAPGVGCPDDFVPNLGAIGQQGPRGWTGDLFPDLGGAVPQPTGNWSQLALRELLH